MACCRYVLQLCHIMSQPLTVRMVCTCVLFSFQLQLSADLITGLHTYNTHPFA
jgi:hypothetical protein